VESILPGIVGAIALDMVGPQVTSQLVGQAGALAAAGQAIARAGFAVVLVVIGLVIWPCVWSRNPERRKAAAEVLDRLSRLARPGASAPQGATTRHQGGQRLDQSRK